MKPQSKLPRGRRSFLKTAAGVLGAGLWSDQALDAALQNTNTASKPSDLKITDLRVATLGGGMTWPIIRIDTNQGISGWGEVRDGSSATYALFLKSRILGENPCNIEKIFRKIKQFGGHARQAGGVVSIEMALWDLAGKAYNVPAYQMLGGKYRDTIRCYCDTPQSPDPKVTGERLKRRMDQGYTWVKIDVGTNMLRGTTGTLSGPGATAALQPLAPRDRQLTMGGLEQLPEAEREAARQRMRQLMGDRNREHMFTGMELTDKGVAVMADYLRGIRDVIGWEIPLATDHYGHIGVNSLIRLGRAFEKLNIAWMEDCVPWYYTELVKKITDAIDIPTCTGEDIYLLEPFEVLCREHAVDIIHPDLSTSGGLLETKRIGDMAQRFGVPMALHQAGSPISFMASVHCAAATEGFLVLEHHGVDVEWYDDMIGGVEKPLVQKGFVKVPEGPGLGITVNEEVMKKHLREPGFFEPTPQWNRERANDRLWS